MSKESKELLKKLDVLAQKIDILTMVTAISMEREKLLKGKTQKEQIESLVKMGLEERNIIALIVGTTPQTVSSRLTEIRAKKKKRKPKRQSKEEKVDQ